MVARLQTARFAGLRDKAGYFIAAATQWARRLRAEPWQQLRSRLTIALAVIAISVLWGMATAVMEFNALFLVIAIIASVFILVDYRAGVIILILIMPISASKFFPHQMFGLTGVNPLNLLMSFTLASYALRRMFGSPGATLLPKHLLWLYIVPIVIAGLIGSRHVHEIPEFLRAEDIVNFEGVGGYLRDVLIKPLQFVIFGLLVGAAAHDMRQPQRLLIPALIAIWIMCVLAIVYFLQSGVGLNDLASPSARTFFNALGLHSNALGRLYVTAYALLLFCLRAAPNGFVRTLLIVSMGLTTVAILLTFSRAAFLAFILVNLAYFLFQRNFKVMGLGLAFALLASFALPGAVYERIGLGLGPDAKANEISAGRTDEIWTPLWPETVRNALTGRGLGTTMWSDAMRADAILHVDHPHNAYLKALLDMGLPGLVLLSLFFWRSWRLLRALARHPGLDPRLREVMQGSAIALAAMLVVGMSGSSLDPIAEQVFFWFAIGMAYGLAQRPGIGVALDRVKAARAPS